MGTVQVKTAWITGFGDRRYSAGFRYGVIIASIAWAVAAAAGAGLYFIL